MRKATKTSSRRHERIPLPSGVEGRFAYTNPVHFRLWRRVEQSPPVREDTLSTELWALTEAAQGGDQNALKRVVELARFLCGALGQVDEELLRPIAATCSSWPVLLSPLDTETRQITSRIQRLGLGEEDVYQPYIGRKIDRSNLWVEYAESVLWTLKVAGEETQRVQAELAKIAPTPKRFEQEGTPGNSRTNYKLIWWELPEDKIFLLYEWQEMAARLPPNLTRDPDCFSAYALAAKFAILHFWAENPNAQEEAFEQAKTRGYTAMETQGALRDGAWKAIKQAMKQLARK